MKTFYLDIHLKNGNILYTYIDTNHSKDRLIYELKEKDVIMYLQLRENGHEVIINKDDISYIELPYIEEVEKLNA